MERQVRASDQLPLFAVLVVASLAVPSHAADAPKTRIYIANDDHTDYMWTADAATYDRVFAEMLDFHLRLIDETAGNPSAFQSRFNADGAFWLRPAGSPRPLPGPSLVRDDRLGRKAVPQTPLHDSPILIAEKSALPIDATAAR